MQRVDLCRACHSTRIAWDAWVDRDGNVVATFNHCQCADCRSENIIHNIERKVNNMWTDAEIIEYYDSHWQLTLRDLSRITGRSVRYLTKLLREE